jgi:equilibrative nucleoside transporter 1/2/3
MFKPLDVETPHVAQPQPTPQTLPSFSTTSPLLMVTFTLLGAGVLLPWNVILSSMDFFLALFPNSDIIFHFSAAYMLLNLAGLVLSLRVEIGGHTTRVLVPYSVYIAVVVALGVVRVEWVLVLLVGVLGFADAVVSGAIFAIAGALHPRYVSAIMTGHGLAGLSICVVRVCAKLAFKEDFRGILVSARVSLAVTAAVLVLDIFLYVFVLKRTRAASSALESGAAGSLSWPGLARLGAITREAKYPIAIAGGTFWITLSLFPGVTSLMTSSSASLNATGWFVVILVALFNLGDLLGRSLPNFEFFTSRLRNMRAQGVMALSRLVFVPLFVLCIRPRVFGDAPAYAIMFVFAVGNGLLTTISIQGGIHLVQEQDKQLAGVVMVFWLTVGLTLGVLTGYAWGAIVSV